MAKKYINKLSTYALASGFGMLLAHGLSGCSNINDNQEESLSQKQNAFIVIEESADGRYSILEEFPSQKTTIILRQKDGSERVLSKEEIDELIKKENERIQNNTSPLTNPEISTGQMSLGGVLLSSIAGAMLGSWISSKLFNNPNFQAQKSANYKSPQVYERSKSSFNEAKKTSNKKSGFFGSTSKKKSNSFFGG